MSDTDRVRYRTAQAALRALSTACLRRREYNKARVIQKAQVALARDYRPGMDLDARLTALRTTLAGTEW